MASFQDIFRQNQYDLKTAASKSRSWFQQQARLLNAKSITPGKALKSNSTKMVRSVIPGSLYMFLYDPKTKDELPYYDVFPLVFPFKKVPGGFLGLNMHYLPYQARIVLLDRLMEFASNDTLNETTKIKYSWSTINGVAKFKMAERCVKHYLTSHVMSSFKMVSPPDWATAMLLPVESFVGASKGTVWRDSLG
jgi:hypothetical protein